MKNGFCKNKNQKLKQKPQTINLSISNLNSKSLTNFQINKIDNLTCFLSNDLIKNGNLHDLDINLRYRDDFGREWREKRIFSFRKRDSRMRKNKCFTNMY